MPTFKQNCQH